MNAIRLAPRKLAGTPAQAFSGDGGLHDSARWHGKGLPIVYTASTLPLAVLERLVHIKRTTSVIEHVFYEIVVPDQCVETPDTLPSNWDSDPPGAASREFGSRWLRESRSAGLCVPSAVIPAHKNLILNPLHREFSLGWVVSGPHPFHFDPRLIAPRSGTL